MLKRKTNPPREDLELNALSDILDSKMFITCHSYVQSEINMLMHVADSMNFTVNTFTHILEGYKLAEKLKNHSAGASTFSDWWAYKFEVNDAIPYNAAILHKKGVVTAINSDDAEMGRRLNQEAAKAIKYGETSEEDAWKMITLNPAILLHLDHKMGSLKSGKDADIVIWSQNPLSVYAIAEKTYIDGKLLFDINRNDYLMKRLPDDALKNYWEKQSQKNSSNFNSKLDYITSPNEHEKTHYTYYGRTKLNVSIFTLKNSIKKYMRKKYIENNLESDVDTTIPYVYFPMSVDMERNLLIDSPMYTNQIEIIRIISKSLPVGYKLYVKENPAQSSREWRSKADYNEIKNIPNVTLIKPSVNGRKLIQNSCLVISIAGTSSLEAAFYEKPSIVFGKVIYNMLPSVQKVGNIQELPELIKKSLKIKVEISDLDKFLQLYENNTLSFDMIEFVNRFNHEFYYDAGLFDVNIDETKLNDFLIKQEDFFSDLISGYIKKINP